LRGLEKKAGPFAHKIVIISTRQLVGLIQVGLQRPAEKEKKCREGEERIVLGRRASRKRGEKRPVLLRGESRGNQKYDALTMWSPKRPMV
jgi:hypothetical protein